MDKQQYLDTGDVEFITDREAHEAMLYIQSQEDPKSVLDAGIAEKEWQNLVFDQPMMNETIPVQRNGTPTFAPIIRGKKGFCYDVNKILDNRVRNRLIRNRSSAELSRKRKTEKLHEIQRILTEKEDQNRELAENNEALRRRIHDVEEEFRAVMESCTGQRSYSPGESKIDLL